ncbi:unconventional myosin-Va-like [Schistocerca serialis cubense]|uniref:unconventional myosin-Va-like n=1 Tax=Schistocerca serialis cubense TaxID=2023355 RepID=UPI00214E9E3B|nr:unconventional myosin-Va-like [Schistocerca serialis cubense]
MGKIDCSGTATVVVDAISASVACAAAVIGLVARAGSDVAGFDGAAVVTEFDHDAVTICGSAAALVVVSRTYSLPAWLLSLQQLEVENRRLHANMTKLQLSFDDCCSNQTLDDEPGREELLKQYNQLQLEVDRWREECIQLHSILAKQTEGLKNVASINYESHVHLINEVVELVLAFEAQKINRQLEDELHQEKNKWQAEREQLQQENEQLREENDNEHKLLSPSLTKSPQTQTEAFMQHEIIRVTSEKLVLQEKLDLAKEELSKCQNSIKLQTEVLKDAGSTIYTIEKVTKKGHDDIDIIVLWLSNTVRLLHNLKQYSGDKTFQTENTSLQNEQCLQNFDLTEYREVLSDTAVEIYQSLAWHIQEKIEPLVVPAILEHEEISGLTSQIPSGKRGRAVLSSWDSEPFLGVQKSLDALLQELNYIYKIMGNNGVDPELTVQIFRQCTDVPTTLQPIIQAAHLLQARKLDEDVQHVCNMCDKLSMLQATLLMDTKFMFPVRFPFNPSKIHLEDIEVPEVLNLPMLKKV